MKRDDVLFNCMVYFESELGQRCVVVSYHPDNHERLIIELIDGEKCLSSELYYSEACNLQRI